MGLRVELLELHELCSCRIDQLTDKVGIIHLVIIVSLNLVLMREVLIGSTNRPNHRSAEKEISRVKLTI